MHRRQFMQTALATLALSRWPLAWAASAPKVVVLGAGLAGLTSAWILRQTRMDVTVVEARERVGGRVWTLRTPFRDGQFAEAGAARVADGHKLVHLYAKHFNLAFDAFGSPVDPLFQIHGKVSKEALPLLHLTAQEHKTLADDPDDGLWDEYVFPVLKQLGDVSGPLDAVLKYDKMSYPDFLRQAGASPDAVRLLTIGYDTSHLSALYVMREMKLAEGNPFKLRGGSERLPQGFAAELKDRIRLKTQVAALERHADGVDVHCVTPSGRETLHADYVICTLPFSVLRGVDVKPAWSPAHQTAIASMSYASVTRTYLQYPSRFWGKGGFALTDDPMEVWAPAWDQPGPGGILMTYANDALARRQAALSPEARARAAADKFRQLFGHGPAPMASTAVVWDDEPFSKGAYCVYQAGQMASMMPTVAAREGRIFFAGEHTSPWCGWMEGALQSAHRATLELQSALSSDATMISAAATNP